MLCIQSLMNQSINNSGRNNDRLGNSVIKMSTNTLTIKNGKPALLTFAMETFPILEATNRQTPTDLHRQKLQLLIKLEIVLRVLLWFP